ncbi:TorD/DmsD family molecular chaperone [Ferrimonas senticii]|uniref:TorD/DmsD family molecular chaperone n=1 Tax=Ferrimonas senticii TaxID=394566 RepID=UPI00146AE829|nr:molecular chaperone TorD family protein [Ferrimonas senticii]
MNSFDKDICASVFGIFHGLIFKMPTSNGYQEYQQSGLFKYWPLNDVDSIKGIQLINGSLENDNYNALLADYRYLLVGPGTKGAYPWGSVYTDRDNLLFGKTTSLLEQFYKLNGVEFELDKNQPLDHVGLIFGALSLLFANNRANVAKELLGVHLLPWVGCFISELKKNSKTGFYQGVAELMDAYLKAISIDMDIKPGKVALYYQ